MKKVVLIHTSLVLYEKFKKLFMEILPNIKIVNIIDDSLLPEVIEHSGITSNVIRRMCAYVIEAEAMGADLILNLCSSVGEAFDIASKLVQTPTLKVDQPMAEKAVGCGESILVVATLSTTLEPSCRLIEAVAGEKGKKITLKPCLVKGAFEALTAEGSVEKHNSMVIDAIKKQDDSADVIVLAQGSMAALLPHLGGIEKPVLASPRLSVERVKTLL